MKYFILAIKENALPAIILVTLSALQIFHGFFTDGLLAGLAIMLLWAFPLCYLTHISMDYARKRSD